jgi:hypothetical protein
MKSAIRQANAASDKHTCFIDLIDWVNWLRR